MAKNKKKDAVAQGQPETAKKNSIVGKIIAGMIIVLLLLCGIFAGLVKLDIFGLGTQIVGPKIQNIPVINMILPASDASTTTEGTTDSEVSTGGSGSGDGYVFQSLDQAVEKLKATEILLKEKEQEAETLSSEIEKLNKEIERLKVFEQNQVQFEADKAEFDRLVAEQAGAEAFMAFVENVYPEQALEIYQSLVQEKVITDEIKTVSDMYENMKAAKAAAILEETSKTDIDMVSQILFQLEPSQAGAILAAMDPTIADKISRYMYPDQTTQ